MSIDMRRHLVSISLGMMLTLFSGCASREPDASLLWQKYQSLESCPELNLMHPFDGALFPPELPSPLVIWEDAPAGCNGWVVALAAGQGDPVFLGLVPGSGFRLPEAAWESIKGESISHPAKVAVIGFNKENPDEILVSGEASFMVSEDPVGAPLFYREVNLPFIEAVKDPSKIRWRFGTVDSKEAPPVVLENLPVCGNCHSFSADGEILGMDVDYANDKGSYAVAEVAGEIELSRENIFSWSDSNSGEDETTFGLLSQVSPDGRYVVSTVRDRSVFVPRDELAFSQLFFPLRGVLEIYDRETGRFFDLPGADDPQYVQSNPSWSPDGEYIVFARSEAYDLKTLDDRGQILLTQEDCAEFLVEGREFKFDLYRILFNQGRGGKAEPLEGASGNGQSNYFAKYSPDGKWIVFCQANSFMLLQPDSRLMIIPAVGGAAREIACNTDRMNSWHTWSPNSRWLVFSSKAFSAYTQLMIAHVDEEGYSAPPVLLDRMTDSNRAANIPEFVNAEPAAISRIVSKFIDDNSFYRAGFEYNRAKDYVQAEVMFRKSLELNPDNLDAHLSLGYLLSNRREYDEAIFHLKEVIRLDPKLPKAYSNLGYIFMWKGDDGEAFGSFTRAVSLNPRMVEAHLGLGVLRLKSGEYDLAENRFRIALNIDQYNISAGIGLAKALRHQGKREQALDVIMNVVRTDPKDIEALLETGELLAELKQYDEALLHFNKVLGLDPGNIRALKGIDLVKRSS